MYRAKGFIQFINESANNMGLSSREVEAIDPDAETGAFELPRELNRLESISFMPKDSSPLDLLFRDFN